MQVPPLKILFSESDRKEILARIDSCLLRGQVAQGENVREFEESFARRLGARNAVAVSSGGAAIEISMRLFGVGGKEVLVPTNTFAASATCVMLAGGKPRLVDTDPATFCVSLDELKRRRTAQTVGIILVHLGGIITHEVQAIRRWCDSEGIWLFEDAAHAHGSSLEGVSAGRFGRAAAFSFFATKVITSGEGGMIVTDDDELADRARGLRDYGKPDPWVSFNTEVASNWRMSEFCAAVGVVHLRRLDEFISSRESIALQYSGLLAEQGELSTVLSPGRSSWYKYIVLLPKGTDREALKRALKEKGVALAGGVYETPLHRQPIFSQVRDPFPLADDVCSRHICLPIYFGMAPDEIAFVCDSLAAAMRQPV